MRRIVLLILCLGAATFLNSQTSAPGFISDPTQIQSKDKFDIQAFPIDKLYMTRSVGSNSWSPDGKQIAFVTNTSGRSNIWLVPSEGGWPTQLTVSNQRQTSVAWSPEGRWIAYVSDYDGNEQWDLFLVSSTSGQVFNLSNTPEVSEESPTWSADGQMLAYAVKPKNASGHEIDFIDVNSKKVTHLTSNTPKGLSNIAPLWSKDGKQIVFTQSRADGKDSNVFVANVSDAKATNLTPHEGEQNFFSSSISPDGKTILISSNARNGYDNVGLLNIATKKIDWLTNEKWEMDAGSFSPDGKHATWTINRDGNFDIFSYDVQGHQAHALPLAKGVNTLGGGRVPFTQDGRRMLYYHDGPNAPGDLWTYDFNSNKSFQVTNSIIGGIRRDDFVEPFLVHYPSSDGKWSISAFVYVPYNAERNGQNAALVYIHGGPTSQTLNSFNRNIQYLVNQGYFVIAPNYRGSTGYGKEFVDANRFDMGGGDLQDIVAAAEWMKKTGYVDPKKVAVMGGSYGGYLTMMAVTK